MDPNYPILASFMKYTICVCTCTHMLTSHLTSRNLYGVCFPPFTIHLEAPTLTSVHNASAANPALKSLGLHFCSVRISHVRLLVTPWTAARQAPERLLLNHTKTLGFLAPGGEEFNPGPETRLDHSELLCNKVLLKYKGDRESF